MVVFHKQILIQSKTRLPYFFKTGYSTVFYQFIISKKNLRNQNQNQKNEKIIFPFPVIHYGKPGNAGTNNLGF
jgi:hypothetical protein